MTFDPALAAVLGFSPILIHYSLMTLISLTVVGAFESVGSILVIAFMIGPAVTAYLMTDNLKMMIILSGIIGALNGILGYQFASYFDVSIAGSMSFMTGLVFMLVFIFSPSRGFLSIYRRRKIQKIDFAGKSLIFHLYNHEGSEDEVLENGIKTIQSHIYWNNQFLKSIIEGLEEDDKIYIEDDVIKLTDSGREYAKKSYEEIIYES